MFSVVTQPLLEALLWLDQLVGNFGIAIILLTLALRLVLLPLTLPSLKAATRMRDLQPEIKKLKKKHGDDKEAFQRAQLELFQKHGVNPLAGCLPQIFQLVIFIALYRVFIDVLSGSAELLSTAYFFGIDLTQPDLTYLLPVLAALSQLILGLMLSPATDTSAEKVLAAETETKADDESAADMSEMAQSIQQQMMLVMPVAIGLFAVRVPAGLALYWVVSTLFSLVQQYLVSGPGGLSKYYQVFKNKISR